MKTLEDARKNYRHGLLRDYRRAMADPAATAETRRRLRDAVLVACNEPDRPAPGPAPSAYRARADSPLGVPTGLAELDAMLGGGAGNGRLIVVASRPSIGRSSFGTTICEHAAVCLNIPTLLISMEMSQNDLAFRLASSMSKIPGQRLRDPRGLSPEDAATLKGVSAEIAASALHIDAAGPTHSAASIADLAGRYADDHDLGLLVVDCLQIIEDERGDYRRGRREDMIPASAQLKALARRLNIPVVAMSRLTLVVEDQVDNRPNLGDLPDAGSIEEDADVVILLHRPEHYDLNDQPGIAEAIVAKNRNGATGTIRLAWRKELTRFDDLEPHRRAGGMDPDPRDF